MWGFDRLDVVNIFALRSTDPKGLYQCSDPIGEVNDVAILNAAKSADMTLAAWGNHGQLGGRGQAVLALLQDAGVELHVLKLSKVGEPVHPLYQPYSALAVPLSDA